MADQPSNLLQTLLQTAVQSVGWTYSLFWQLCPQQGILVWGDGYYNGAIKTRKMVQPMEVSTEESSLHRSEQLRELYDSLAATNTGSDTHQLARRPSAALSPEDLTESEWFYLMCVSFSFPPGVGLPGKAYATRKHVWLTGTSDVDSKVFSRAILAKSARVQTVVCIPLLDGVIELGTTEKVQEDLRFVKRVTTFFTDCTWSFPPKPALSGHDSTSNSVVSLTMPPAIYTPVVPMEEEDDQEHEGEDQEEEEDNDDDDDNEEVGEYDQEDEDIGKEQEEEAEGSSDAEAGTGYDHSRFSSIQNHLAMADDDDHAVVVVEPNELMHNDLSEGIRFGSPDDGSNFLDSEFHLLGSVRQQADSFESHDQLLGYNPFGANYLQLDQPPGAPQPEVELTQEDTHYSHTVSTILRHQSNRFSDASTLSGYAIYSTQSAFARWTSQLNSNTLRHQRPSQWVLKYVHFTVPYLHTKSRDGAAAESASRFRKGDDTNHVLAERRRREKLNERFIILRSLVPFVTKMDKASILGDTIEYLKQLRKRIQDLEARAHHANPVDQRLAGSSSEKRKGRKMEGDNGEVGKPKAMEAPTQNAGAAEVEVSIIESDALVEMQCRYREGLLLDVMQVLRELRVEITTVQSSLSGGLFTAEMRAKVKENVRGKKLTIMEVKRAINQIMPKSY